MKEAELCARDNALAAVGRMLRGCTANQIPHAEVVPMFLQACPLRADFEESEGILKVSAASIKLFFFQAQFITNVTLRSQTLVHLCFGGCDKSILEQHQGEFLKAIVCELVNGSLTKGTKEQAKSILVSGVQRLGPEHPAIVAIANSDPKYKQLLTNLLQQ